MDVTDIIEMPVIATRGMLVFPGHEISLDVGRSFSLKAIDNAMRDYDENVVFVSQVNPLDEATDYQSIYHTGTMSKIKRRIKRDNHGTIKLTAVGTNRVSILDIEQKDGCLFAKVAILDDEYGDKNEELALVRRVSEQLQLMSKRTQLFPREVVNTLSQGLSASELADTIGMYIQSELASRQKFLDENNVNKRLLLVLTSLEEEKIINEIESQINTKIKETIDANQREYYLREKLRAIKEELGDTPNKEDDSDFIRNKINTEPFPKHVKEKIEDELRRFEMMPSGSSEANVVRTYIDWLLKTPWYETTEDQEDILEVERILNEDHYGLEKPKERIVEHLAVKQMTQSLNAPIICLVGPPGVGKTSISKSIAKALNRKFVKASLGGVKDESEIRGHRRTYLGSMPGRIIQSMKKAGVINPVFLLDEIDKMASDFRGDPTSAMLEVLDPEQNQFFSDNYLEEPYDLSKVLFVATANDLWNIPAPLRDRLEVIEISSYTEQEKLEIAKRHLLKKETELHGLKPEQLLVNDDVLMFIIRHYTRESGVRQLERLIAKICRKAVLKILKEKVSLIELSINDLEEYLGKVPYEHTKKMKEPQIGVVTGMAYTQFGGDILPIEVNYFEGTGKFIITGQLGDVMKESASIALDYIKSNKDKYNLNDVEFDKLDIHIHVPEGAVKKDGPSAGVTLTTALISAFSKTKVRDDIAMTGEITLRGNVFPIGGLKEKSISAHRSGIKKIIIPKDNAKDIDDIPESVQKELTIVLAEHIDTVLEHALLR